MTREQLDFFKAAEFPTRLAHQALLEEVERCWEEIVYLKQLNPPAFVIKGWGEEKPMVTLADAIGPNT